MGFFNCSILPLWFPCPVWFWLFCSSNCGFFFFVCFFASWTIFRFCFSLFSFSPLSLYVLFLAQTQIQKTNRNGRIWLIPILIPTPEFRFLARETWGQAPCSPALVRPAPMPGCLFLLLYFIPFLPPPPPPRFFFFFL